MIYGIDISSWQGDIDLAKHSPGFVIIRAGCGRSEDGKAKRNMDEFTVEAETLAVASYRGNATNLAIFSRTQTASVANLFAAGDVKDEQDIISGTVTRRTEVSVVGGVISISALSSPVTERVTPKYMSTVEGSNTVTVTSAVDPVTLTVEYATAAGD